MIYFIFANVVSKIILQPIKYWAIPAGGWWVEDRVG